MVAKTKHGKRMYTARADELHKRDWKEKLGFNVMSDDDIEAHFNDTTVNEGPTTLKFIERRAAPRQRAPQARCGAPARARAPHRSAQTCERIVPGIVWSPALRPS